MKYPQCVEKAEAIYAHWERGDGDMGELAIGLYDLTAHYKALYEDYIRLEKELAALKATNLREG